MKAFNKPAKSALALKYALHIMRPLARFLIRNGVGYTEFSQSIKQVFFEQALHEVDRLGSKQTDSALSLIAGLQRKEINSLMCAMEANDNHLEFTFTYLTVPVEVLSRWLERGYGDSIAISDATPCFEMLVKEVSTEKHPRSVLDELQRIGAIKVDKQLNKVYLLTEVFQAETELEQSVSLIAKNTHDYLSNSFSKIYHEIDEHFLNDSIHADKLTSSSINLLASFAKKQWQMMMPELNKFIDALKMVDDGKDDAIESINLGIFSHHTSSAIAPPKLKKSRKRQFSEDVD